MAGTAESKQLAAIAAIRAANASCRTVFYLNSQIDFPELALHAEFVAANGTWWLRDDEGGYLLHRPNEHVIDWTVPAAREAWLDTAAKALAEGSVDGIFVDKASNGQSFHGVRRGRMRAWNEGHDTLLASLRKSTAKLVLLNNAHAAPAAPGGAGMGQLFERWGNPIDHDKLDLVDDMKLLGELQTDGLVFISKNHEFSLVFC